MQVQSIQGFMSKKKEISSDLTKKKEIGQSFKGNPLPEVPKSVTGILAKYGKRIGEHVTTAGKGIVEDVTNGARDLARIASEKLDGFANTPKK